MAIDRKKVLESARKADSEGRRAKINYKSEVERINDEYTSSYKSAKQTEGSKTTPTTSRAGVKTESNTAVADEKAREFINANRGKETAYLATAPNAPKYVVGSNGGTAPAVTPSVNASVAERNAARRSAQKENTEKKFTQPGNSGQLPGDARSQSADTHVEIDKSKSKAGQISELNRKVKDEEYYKSDIQKKASIDNSRERVSVEYTEKYNNMSTDAKALLSFINREDETEDYMKWAGIAAGFAGIEGGGGAVAGQLAGSMTTSQEARKMLRELYGMSNNEIDAAVILHNRARRAEAAKRQENEMKQIANDNPFLASALSVPMGVASDVMPFFEMADSFEERQKTRALGMAPLAPDENNMYSALGRGRDTLQSTVSENINKKYGEFASTTYDAVIGGITNAAENVAFGKANEAVLSINAGVGAYKNARARGLSDEDCLKTAAVAMVAEFIGEHLGSTALRSGKKILGKTMKEFAEKTLTPDTLGKLLLTTAKNVGSNAGEEVLTSAINGIYDYFANGELSEYQLSVDAYMQDGNTKEDAIKNAKTDIAKNLLKDAYAGAITGLMFNTTNVANYGIGQASLAATGKYAKQQGYAPSIIAAAKEAPEGSKPNKLAGKEKMSNYTLGKTAKANSDFYNAESTGRFSNVETQAELDERYQSAMQMKKDKGSDSAKQIQKEYEQTETRIRMKNAAEGAKPTGYKKTDVLTRVEITNPTVKVDGKEFTAQGKNVDTKTGEISDAQTVFKDADGDNAIRFGDGKTMKVSEAVKHMTDKTAKEVYKATDGMTAEAANLFVSNYDGDDIGDYTRAFKYFTDMGRTGLSATQIKEYNPAFGNYFTAEAQEQIATEGLKNREFRAGVTELTFARSTKQFKQTVQLIDQYAKESSLEVIILNENSRINGYHLQGTNRIVLYANVGGKENLMTRTFGHETFHFISENSSEEADKLRNYVVEALKKNGVDIETELIKYGNIKDDNGNLVYATREAQIDELVADSMFNVFTNKAAIDRLAKNDRSLAQKIADKFKEILNVIRTKLKMMGETSKNNPEIKALMNDAESLEKIVNQFHDSLDVAKNNFNVQDSGKDAGNIKALEYEGFSYDKATESFTYSYRYGLDSENMRGEDGKPKYTEKQLAEMMSVINGKSLRHNLKFIKDNRSIANIFLNESSLDYIADDDYSAIKSNAEYEGGTVDFNTDCRKRQEFTEIYNSLQARFPDHVFTADEMAMLREHMVKNGITVACGLCFVEDRRQKLGENAREYIGMYKKAAASGEALAKPTRKKGKPDVVMRVTEAIYKEYGDALGLEKGDEFKVTDQYIPNQYDLGTADGFSALKKNHPQVAAGYIAYNNSRGQQAGRLIEPRTEYKRQILEWSEKKIKNINDHGGLRIFSFSDFEAIHALDLIQIVEDCAAVGLKIQSYTKQNEFARMIKDTGVKLNRSLIPTASGIKVVNGKKVLAFDTREGIDVNSKDFFDTSDNPNVGNIIIGINREQIKLAMTDDFVDFIIPFHTGQTRRVLERKNVPTTWKNYRSVQNERTKKDGKLVRAKSNVNIYTDVIQKYNVKNKVEFVEGFLKECKENNLVPRFDEFLDIKKDENGNDVYVYTEGYHKFLVDFKLFDKKGNILPQNVVEPKFNTGYIKEMLAEYVEGQKMISDRADKRNKIVDEFAKMLESGELKARTAQNIADYKAHKTSVPETFVNDKYETIRPKVFGNKEGAGDTEINSGVLFSMNKDSSIDAHYGEVIKELNQWRVIGDLLTEEGIEHTNKDSMLNSRDIHRISKNIITKTKSKYDLATLENQLTAVFEYIKASGKHVDAAEVSEVLYKLSHDVLSQSEMRDTELYEQYSEARKLLHDTQVYIPENVRKEIASQFGDFKSFRNQLMGKMMHITTTDSNARSLDEVWQELSEMAPEYFPKDTNELDMPMQLTRFFEIIAPKTVNPYEHYEMNIADEAAVLANDIFTDYTKIRLEKTDSGKAKDILNAGMRKLNESKKAMIAEFDRKKLQNADEYRTRLAEYRQQRQDADRRRVNRNEIERNYNYVNRRYVNGKDTDKILKKFNDVTQAYVKSVPDANSRFSKQNLIEFENEYRKLEGETVFYDSDFATKISTFRNLVTQKEIGMPRLRDLDNVELQMLTDITSHMKYIVQTENRLFNESIKAKADELGMKIDSEFKNKGESKLQGIGDNSTRREVVAHKVDELIKGFVKPAYLFDNLGSETLKMLYDEIQKGENIEAKIIYDSKLAEQDIKKRNNYDARWNSQTVELNLRSGKRAVSVEDAMALYATSKRKQGLEHLINGGAVIYSAKDIRKNEKRWQDIKKTVLKNAKKNRLELSDAEVTKRTNDIYNSEIAESDKITIKERVYFNEQDIAEIENALTPDQRKYVDEMVGYITNDIGEKRNEVSMKLYGYEKYKESYYFPIKVDRNFIDTSVGRPEVVSTIQNQSSAKKTVDRAKNPIEITGFTNTVNNHIYDSALYCAYVLPISDFRRVYNFKDKVSSGEGAESLVYRDVSVKEDIKKANGVNAINEIEKFMIALDSGSRYENVMPVSAQLASRMKKTAVMANLSVVVQQPTAVFRAMLYVNPKHFTTWANKADIEEMKRWNGCALKKEIGYFDVNMGRSATDYMNEYDTDKSIKKNWSLKDKFKNSNGMQKLDEAAGWAASKADEQTWGAIWKACKKQVKSENSSLSGDSLNSAASELFQKTISKTQVYDSVFTKPEFMRRKEGFAMMTTQFMSEPLTSLNMLAEAVSKQKNAEKGSQQRKDARKFTARAFGCFATSLVVNSALKSLIYTMRDDDEENTFLEKYIANFTEGVATDPIGMIPYVKDVLSIVQGYELERTDVAVFTTFAEAVKNLGNDNKSTFDKIMGVMKAAGQASGIPAYNVVRDAKAIIGIASKIVDGIQNGFPETTGRGILNELKDVFGWVPGIDAQTNYEQLYDSMLKGDKKHYDRVYNSLVGEGKEKSVIDGGIAEVLAKNDGRIAELYDATAKGDVIGSSKIVSELKEIGFSDEIINRALTKHQNNLMKEIEDDERIEAAAAARYNMDYDEYERIVDEIVSEGYSSNIVKKAVESKKIELETSAYEFKLAGDEEYKASYDLKNAIYNGESSDVKTVHSKLSKDIGKEKADGYVRSYAKEAYKNRKISLNEAERYLLDYKKEESDSNDVFWEVEEMKFGDGYKKYGKLYDAIDNGGNLSATVEYYTSHGVDESTISSYITKEYKPRLLGMNRDTAEFNEMYESVIDAFVATGNTESKARKKVKKWFE